MDRRRQPRINAMFPVRMWGVDAYGCPFLEVACARNVSQDGVLLDGVRCRLKPGEVVELQYNGKQAQFIVVWADEPDAQRGGEIGLQVLGSTSCIWDVNLTRCVSSAAVGTC